MGRLLRRSPLALVLLGWRIWSRLPPGARRSLYRFVRTHGLRLARSHGPRAASLAARRAAAIRRRVR